MSGARGIPAGPQGPTEVETASWLGRLDFDLADEHGALIGKIEMVVRTENITMWYGSRTLAVMDREVFRQWLVRPFDQLPIHDLVWFVAEDTLYLTIDDGVTYAVPNSITMKLVTVI
jgi:hypothetical protein